MKNFATLSLLVACAGIASAQTATQQLQELKTRLEANAQKLSNLKQQLAEEKALDDLLITNTNTLITQSYQRGNQITSIKAALPSLESKTQFLTVSGNNLYLTGANLQIKNGSALATNTLGNLIVGHNRLRASGNSRLGSHNLIFGNGANYSKDYGIIGGLDNNLYSPYGAILTGTKNEVSGSDLFQVVMSGQNNRTTANAAVVLTGRDNLVSSVRSVIASGYENDILFSYENVIVTGEKGMIEGGTRSFIATGLRNMIQNAQYSGIGTGTDHLVNGNWKFTAK